MLSRVVRALPKQAMPWVRRLYCAVQGRSDAGFVARTGERFLPPAHLRFHVGSIEPGEYVRIGRRCAADLEQALRSIGRSWESFERVLDFGCGCGRTLVRLRHRGPQLYGSDLHPGCIDWCAERLAFGSFRLNGTRPPLDFAAGVFDLVYSLSVFTHLDESDQLAWLGELRRVCRSGAVLLLSVHGRHCWKELSPEEISTVEQCGILVKEARALWGVFERYFNTYHSEAYVRRTWGEPFTVLDYVPRGINDHQDLVILERP